MDCLLSGLICCYISLDAAVIDVKARVPQPQGSRFAQLNTERRSC